MGVEPIITKAKSDVCFSLFSWCIYCIRSVKKSALHIDKAYNTKQFTFYLLFTKKESNSKVKLCVKMGNEQLFFTKMDLSYRKRKSHDLIFFMHIYSVFNFQVMNMTTRPVPVWKPFSSEYPYYSPIYLSITFT